MTKIIKDVARNIKQVYVEHVLNIKLKRLNPSMEITKMPFICSTTGIDPGVIYWGWYALYNVTLKQ